MFDTMGIAGSGVTVYRKWLDAVSDNIANVDTVRPTNQAAFRERFVVAQSVGDGGAASGVVPASLDGESAAGGVVVAGAKFGDATGRLVYAPDHPLADAKGMVRYPDIDLGQQMTSLLMAQRGYQANLAVITRAQEAYSSALQLGRGA